MYRCKLKGKLNAKSAVVLIMEIQLYIQRNLNKRALYKSSKNKQKLCCIMYIIKTQYRVTPYYIIVYKKIQQKQPA